MAAHDPRHQRSHDGRRLVVMESFGLPHGRTNPYSILLFSSMPARLDARYFSWKLALFGSFDVFHLHWPEVKVRGTTPTRSAIRTVLFLALLVRIRLTHRALVRTLHDSVPHEEPNAVQRWVIGRAERWTTLWIVLNDEVRPPGEVPVRRSRIGHFEGWFPDADTSAVPGRVLHFGLVRRYKGTGNLLRVVESIDDPTISLRIVGLVHEPQLLDDLQRASDRDRRITFEDAYVTDEQLAAEVRRSELVVLPFSRITNSSSLLVALSLGRPVLAPAAPAILEVADEVGPGWVFTYDGELDATHLTNALVQIRAEPDRPAPDLSLRAWPTIGEEHAAAFEAAAAIVGRN